MNTGNKKLISKNKLLTTICYRLNNKNTFALEGSIFVAGAGVQWLRDKIGLINTHKQCKIRAENMRKDFIDLYKGPVIIEKNCIKINKYKSI